MKNINKNKCHSVLDTESSTLAVSQQQQQPAWKILKQVQDDGLICYNSNSGFTLIELLVVVLIIGILAAVALPQYNKAVIKSRLATLKPLLATLKTAEEEYYLINNTYTNDLNVLSVSLSCTHGVDDLWYCDNYFMIDPIDDGNNIRALYCPGKHAGDYGTCSTNADFTYLVWFDHSDYPSQIDCDGRTSLGTKICSGVQ